MNETDDEHFYDLDDAYVNGLSWDESKIMKTNDTHDFKYLLVIDAF